MISMPKRVSMLQNMQKIDRKSLKAMKELEGRLIASKIDKNGLIFETLFNGE